MKQRLIWILWPSFVMAIPAVGIVFSLFDPADMKWPGEAEEHSGLAAYTMGFLFFWALGACCSALTCLLQRSPYEIDRCTLDPQERPDGCPKRESPGGCH